jgi:5'-deoxynucleotidase YfbR-like HD superfamily hydrolase
LEYLKIRLTPVSPGAAAAVEALWIEYEECETDVAKLVHGMDILERGFQAMIYEERTGQAQDFEEFRKELETKIIHPKVQEWAEILLRKWAALRSRRDADMIIVFVIGNALGIP